METKRCSECLKYYLAVDWMESRVNGYCSEECKEKRENILARLDPRVIGNGMSYLERLGYKESA